MTTITRPGPRVRSPRETPGGTTSPRTGTGRARPPAGRRSGLFVVMFVTVSFLAVLGLVMVLSASSAEAVENGGSAWAEFRSQGEVFRIRAAATGKVRPKAAAVQRTDFEEPEALSEALKAWTPAATPAPLSTWRLLISAMISDQRRSTTIKASSGSASISSRRKTSYAQIWFQFACSRLRAGLNGS